MIDYQTNWSISIVIEIIFVGEKESYFVFNEVISQGIFFEKTLRIAGFSMGKRKNIKLHMG